MINGYVQQNHLLETHDCQNSTIKPIPKMKDEPAVTALTVLIAVIRESCAVTSC
jgi:hypothetical protein